MIYHLSDTKIIANKQKTFYMLLNALLQKSYFYMFKMDS
jgi:hypothetical protein